MSETALITIALDAASKAAMAQLTPGRVLAAVQRGMDRALPLVTGFIQKERATGKGPFPVSEHRLGVRTNRYRAGMRWTRAAIVGDVVVGRIGDNVSYAAIHEFGFAGDVQVKAHARRIGRVNGNRTTLAAVARTQKSRKKAKPESSVTEVQVKAHARAMSMPERKPIRTGIAEHADEFTKAIALELQRELGQTGATPV